MSYRAWVCETCGRTDPRTQPWDCPGCGKETCEHCFDRYAHCKPCAAGKDDETVRLAANDAGWDFEPHEATA